MKKQIGWYTIEIDSEMNQKCFDSNGKECFLKEQQIQNDEGYLEEQKMIYEKLKWNRFSNVVRILDYHFESSQLIIFMEKCDLNLSQYIKNEMNNKKNQLNLKFYQNLISQVSNGYLELMSLQMLHRDIKPDNILVVKENSTITYKICDFDISKKENDIQRLTHNQKGTQAYKAPEIQNSEYSYAADMFSFGLVVFQILSGYDCFNKNKKSLQNFYEELKTKGFDQIMKEKQHTMQFNIEEDKIPEIITILSKMLAYNKHSRILWEDLYQNIYHLEKLNKYQPNPETFTEKTNNKKQLSINTISQPQVIFTKQKQSCQNFLNNQNFQFPNRNQNQKNLILNHSQPDFKKFLEMNKQFTQNIQQNEPLTERSNGFKGFDFPQNNFNCSNNNLQRKQFLTILNLSQDEQSEQHQERIHSQSVHENSNPLEQNKNIINIPAPNFGQQVINGKFDNSQEKPNIRRCYQSLVQNQSIPNANQFQNFHNIKKDKVYDNLQNEQYQTERQQINNFQKPINNFTLGKQQQPLKQNNQFQQQQ